MTAGVRSSRRADDARLAGLLPELLKASREAIAAGDYGIAATLLVRAGGREVRATAANAVFSTGDPSAHAEVRALRAAQAALTGRTLDGSTIVWGPAPHNRTEIVLVTSLEPCPICCCCLATAAVDRVVIAHPDPRAGALLSPQRLPIRWREALDHVRVDSFGHAPGEIAAPPDVLADLRRTFEVSCGRMGPFRESGMTLARQLADHHLATSS